jgi:hypothetical protein
MKLDWSEVPSIWWSIMWRTALYAGIPVGFVSTFLARLVYGAASPAFEDALLGYRFVFELALGVPLSMLALKFGLEKHLPLLREEHATHEGDHHVA